MLFTAFLLLAVAVLTGSLAAVLLMRERAPLPPWPLAALHATLALAGLAILLAAAGVPPAPRPHGSAGFALTAETLLGLAALTGLGLLAARLTRRRPPGALIGTHATLAVSGFVILAAWLFA